MPLPARFSVYLDGLAVLSVALGIKLTLLHFNLPYPLSSSFLAAIAIAFWSGGIVPGAIAVVVSSKAQTQYDPRRNLEEGGVRSRQKRFDSIDRRRKIKPQGQLSRGSPWCQPTTIKHLLSLNRSVSRPSKLVVFQDQLISSTESKEATVLRRQKKCETESLKRLSTYRSGNLVLRTTAGSRLSVITPQRPVTPPLAGSKRAWLVLHSQRNLLEVTSEVDR